MRNGTRLIVIGCAVWWCLSAPLLAQYDPRMDLILEELQQLRESVDALTHEVHELRDRPADRPAARAPARRTEFHGPDHDALAEIEFPADPVPDALRTYINQILRATENQQSYSSRDPQVDMLMRVGGDHVDLLLESMRGHSRGLGGHYHARKAVIRLADESHKELVLEHLPDVQALARVVVRFGWEEDAKDILLDGLAAIPEYLPNDWIQAVANLDDPEVQPLLLNFLMHGGNKRQTYRVVSGHVDEGLDEAVEEAWRQSRRDWERNQMAPIAALHGVQDALDYMVRKLAAPHAEDDHSMREWRPAIIRVTGFRGSTTDLIDWYEENRDALAFDPEQGRYIVSE